jgi:hypothetical protein
VDFCSEKECGEISRGNGNGTGEKEKKKLYARTSILICINPHSSTGMILLNAVKRTGNTAFCLFEE